MSFPEAPYKPVSEQYRLAGQLVSDKSADYLELRHACAENFKIEKKPGLTVILTPTGSTPWRSGYWVVTFNPADLYFPHDWFNEASSNHGPFFNRQQHGPRAGDLFIDYIRRGPIALPSKVN